MTLEWKIEENILVQSNTDPQRESSISIQGAAYPILQFRCVMVRREKEVFIYNSAVNTFLYSLRFEIRKVWPLAAIHCWRRSAIWYRPFAHVTWCGINYRTAILRFQSSGRVWGRSLNSFSKEINRKFSNLFIAPTTQHHPWKGSDVSLLQQSHPFSATEKFPKLGHNHVRILLSRLPSKYVRA